MTGMKDDNFFFLNKRQK